MTGYAKSSIRTRYHGPTNHRGSRITASADDDARSIDPGQTVTIGWDYSLDVGSNHAAAAQAWLAARFSSKVLVAEPALVFNSDHFHTWTYEGDAT